MVRVRTAGPGRTRTIVPDGSVSPRDDSPATGTSSSAEEIMGGEARERILDAAEDLFAADGFDATPTSRIAHRAAVAKGLLFYYFPRRIDLLRTLFLERLPVHSISSLAGIAVRGTWPVRSCGWPTGSASPVIIHRCSARSCSARPAPTLTFATTSTPCTPCSWSSPKRSSTQPARESWIVTDGMRPQEPSWP
jgi:hypothetical protein